MKIITEYQCEICGTKWGCEEAALICEAFELDPCPLKPGDKVEAYERYDKPQPDEVVEVYIGPSFFTGEGGVLPMRAETLDGWNEFLKERQSYVDSIPFHEWKIKLKHFHKYSKDDDAYTDVYNLSNVRLPGSKTWLDGKGYGYE